MRMKVSECNEYDTLSCEESKSTTSDVLLSMMSMIVQTWNIIRGSMIYENRNGVPSFNITTINKSYTKTR